MKLPFVAVVVSVAMGLGWVWEGRWGISLCFGVCEWEDGGKREGEKRLTEAASWFAGILVLSLALAVVVGVAVAEEVTRTRINVAFKLISGTVYSIITFEPSVTVRLDELPETAGVAAKV